MIGRAKNSARLRLDSVYHLYAPVLSRSARVSLSQMGTNGRAVRLYSPEVVREGWRLKTGAEKSKIQRHVGCAEFFALPGFAPIRPFAHSPFRRTYSPNVLASPFSASSTTSILIKLVLPETLYGVPATIVSTSFGCACRIFTAASALDFTR